jgi:RND family efflux transporter MFP subunit
MNSRRIIIPLVGILLVGALLFQARAASGTSKTAAAPAPVAPEGFTVEGRVAAYPGAEVLVGSDRAGTIVRLAVQEKDRVRKGDLIAELRSDELRAEVAEARARVSEAEADIRLFETEVERTRQLWDRAVGTKQSYDRAVRDRDAARARRQTALASVDRLEALVDKTRIVAPIDGVVIERMVDRGETIEAGDPLVTIADLTKLRVETEVDEFDVARVRAGGEAKITAEGLNDSWIGEVEEIPDAVTSRRLKPQDPSRPIDARVLLVKIALPAGTPLKLGQRVEVELR